MTSNAKVAVITRTKNRVLLLERAVSSVLNQTCQDWQHVVVNDGGAHEPVDELLEKFKEEYKDRLTVIHNPNSIGMEAASNQGLKAADSEFVVIHDDDDSWEPTFLTRCIEELERCPFKSVKGVVTKTIQVFEKINDDKVVEERRQEFDPNLKAITLPQMSEINCFLPISFLFKRSVFEEIGFYDESLPVIGDWEFNIRFLMKFDIMVVHELLANYHVRTNAEPAYENSVSAAQNDHQFYRSLIINKHIRNDLENGHMTRGSLLLFGDYFYRTSAGTARIANFIDKVKGKSLVSALRRIFRI